jgi:hypothetical protein
VTAKAGNWDSSFADVVMPGTGTKNTLKGPVVFMSDFFCGLASAMPLLPAGWSVNGALPYLTVQSALAGAFRAAVAGKLIQSLMLLYYTEFDGIILASVNTDLKALMNGFVDSALANDFASPDIDPTSSLIFSKGTLLDRAHVKCVIRLT